MTPADGRDVLSVAALAEPIRRRLYDLVAAAPEALSREQAAEAAGLPVHTAKFHLDKLVDEGLLETDFRRLSGRTGPGSGRPSKLYRRVDREIAVALPARQYDLLSRILANAVAESVATGAAVAEVASRVAYAEGEDFGRAQQPTDVEDLSRVRAALEATGYEPRRRDGEVLELRNCPFHQAATQQRALVCGLNLDFVTGLCRGLAAETAHPALEPQAGRCCVTVTGEPDQRPGEVVR